MGIQEALDSRREVTVDEYEKIETIRENYIENPNVQPDFSVLGDWFDRFYKGNNYLYLKEVKDYYRTYEWS
jgi:hydroxymethylglutaryl-CoA synthase